MKQPTASARPRAAVIAEAWAQVGITAQAFVNRHGIPLARTTKCLLDPLVLRPRIHRNLAQPLLTATDAAQIRDLLTAARGQIEDASAWYERLRALRSARGITEGNPQELYFPRAFELAVTSGAPGQGADAQVSEVLEELHSLAAGHNEVTELLTDPRVAAQVERTWREEWAVTTDVPDVAALAAAANAALDDWARVPDAPGIDPEEATRFGLALRSRKGLVAELLESAGAMGGDVRVAKAEPLEPPALRGRGQLPLERTLEQRIRAALRRLREQVTATDAAAVVDEETWRCLCAFGLRDNELQALFVAGLVLAAHLDPLAQRRTEATVRPSLAAQLAAKLRKEAYVMYLRRELAAGGAIHPGQEPVVAELAQFWRPWLNRLWARLHGRDVTASVLDESPGELLRGITRSVMLDHRQRIRGVLAKVAA